MYLQLVPSSWKTSRTILLHKDGDLKEPSNWRPIALINTIARLFTSCLATRLLLIIQKHTILSPEQKGFLPADGCIEHNFMLQSILQHAKSNKNQLAIAWLDIKNAFGSNPHTHIFEALSKKGFTPDCQRIVRELYIDSSTAYSTSRGPSPQTPINSGVKQGCPLSHLIFNLTIDSMMRLPLFPNPMVILS